VINLATVYRTLEMLVEKGLASRLDLGGGRVVYATRQHGPHVHLVCRGCHKVIDAEQSMLTSLAQDLLARYGFTADLQHISIVGLCAACQAKT
jgi:Fur family ferric uptake transcriptional regulator